MLEKEIKRLEEEIKDLENLKEKIRNLVEKNKNVGVVITKDDEYINIYVPESRNVLLNKKYDNNIVVVFKDDITIKEEDIDNDIDNNYKREEIWNLKVKNGKIDRRLQYLYIEKDYRPDQYLKVIFDPKNNKFEYLSDIIGEEDYVEGKKAIREIRKTVKNMKNENLDIAVETDREKTLENVILSIDKAIEKRQKTINELNTLNQVVDVLKDKDMANKIKIYDFNVLDKYPEELDEITFELKGTNIKVKFDTLITDSLYAHIYRETNNPFSVFSIGEIYSNFNEDGTLKKVFLYKKPFKIDLDKDLLKENLSYLKTEILKIKKDFKSKFKEAVNKISQELESIIKQGKLEKFEPETTSFIVKSNKGFIDYDYISSDKPLKYEVEIEIDGEKRKINNIEQSTLPVLIKSKSFSKTFNINLDFIDRELLGYDDWLGRFLRKEGNKILLEKYEKILDEKLKKAQKGEINIDAKDKNGNSILLGLTKISYYYVKDKDKLDNLIEKIKYVVDKGANLNIQDNEGKSALHVLGIMNSPTDYKFSDLIKYILKKGADPNIQDEKGRTPLYDSVFFKDLETTNILLQNGADPTIEDKYNDTPLKLASRLSKRKLYEVLSNYIKNIKIDMNKDTTTYPDIDNT